MILQVLKNDKKTDYCCPFFFFSCLFGNGNCSDVFACFIVIIFSYSLSSFLDKTGLIN